MRRVFITECDIRKYGEFGPGFREAGFDQIKRSDNKICFKEFKEN